MRDKFKLFETERNKIDERIEELKAELEDSYSELEQLQQNRADALRDFMKPSNVANFETGIEQAKKRIKQLEESVQYAQQGKLEQLTALIPVVEEYKHKASAQKEKEYEIAIEELNRRKIEYLLHMKKIGQLANEVNEIHETENRYRRESGIDPVRYWGFTDRMKMNANPSLNGFDQASAECLGIESWLVKSALDGKLPNWSNKYINKGDGSNDGK